jgi:hypothetical protein
LKRVIREYINLDLDKETLITRDFNKFAATFKKRFTRYLQSIIGANEVDIKIGYFFINGYFTVGRDLWYFSTGDLRLRREMYIEVDKGMRNYYGRYDSLDKYGMYIPVNDEEEFLDIFEQKILSQSYNTKIKKGRKKENENSK